MEPKPITLKIKLDTLTCHRVKDDRKKADAYLWVIFFKVGGNKLKITETFRLSGSAEYKFSTDSQGNLGETPFRSGDIYKIPPNIGEWETVLFPLVLPHFEAPITSVAGCLVVLMEKNNLTAKGAEAAHTFLNEYVENAVKIALNEFDPRLINVNNLVESVKDYFVSKLTSLTKNLEHEIGQVVMKSQNLLENLWTLIDKDRLIGYDIWTFTHESLKEAEGHEVFKDQLTGEGGETWEFSGYAEIVTPVQAKTEEE